MKRCAPCGKEMHATEAIAKDVLVKAKIQRALYRNSKRKEKRTYPCPHGNGWHLTSQEAIQCPTTVPPVEESA